MIKRTRILLAKTALDGHWRGLTVVASALRDAGFEVIMLGMSREDQIIRAVIEEDVDLLGLNVGGHINTVKSIVSSLRIQSPEVPVIVGGAIPPWAKLELEKDNVEVYPPGTLLTDIVAAAKRLTA